MFASEQKSTGTQYTVTVAFLMVAFIFIPAVLLVSRPLGYVSVSIAVLCSGLCAAMAWLSWTKFSNLTVPSIAAQRSGQK
jgi:hypothetical protein